MVELVERMLDASAGSELALRNSKGRLSTGSCPRPRPRAFGLAVHSRRLTAGRRLSEAASRKPKAVVDGRLAESDTRTAS